MTHLKQLFTLFTSQLLRQASTPRWPSSTTACPELQLQQAASDVTSGQCEEAANVVQLQPHILSQSHQLEVATDICLEKKVEQDGSYLLC